MTTLAEEDTPVEAAEPSERLVEGSAFAQGNFALRNKDYSKAMECYLAAPFHDEILGRMIAMNAVLARRGRRRDQARVTGRPRVAVCAWDLSLKTTARAVELAQLYETFADVEIIGSVFAKRGEADLSSEAAGAPMPVSFIRVASPASFIEVAQPFVMAHPCDVVHLSKPRTPNILMGLLYRLIWDARVVVDIDEDELAALRQPTPVSVQGYLRKRKTLPPLDQLNGEDWTRLAVGLADKFDWLSTSTEALRKRFGGFVQSGETKFRNGSLSRLRRQTSVHASRPGATSSEALSVMELLPEGRRLHDFGVLLDIHTARLGKAPPAGAPRARIAFAPRIEVQRQPVEQIAAVPPSGLEPATSDVAAELSWSRAADFRPNMDGSPLIVLAGAPLGMLAKAAPVPPGLSALRAFCGLHALDLVAALKMKIVNDGVVSVVADWPSSGKSDTGGLDGLGVVLADAWYTSDSELRMRFEGRSGEISPDEACVARCYQLDSDSAGLRLVAEVPVHGSAPVFADVPLLDPLSPLLLTVTSPAGVLRAAALLPYPSLCRGGWHNGELAAVGSSPEYMANLLASSGTLLAEHLTEADAAAPFSIGRISVDLQGATGAEKIFSPHVQAWFRNILSLGRPSYAGGDASDNPKAQAQLESALLADAGPPEGAQAERIASREKGGALTLHLPADSLPTLSALLSRRLSLEQDTAAAVGAYVLANPLTGKPQSVVTLPPMGEGLLALQPRNSPVCFPVLRRAADAGPVPGSIQGRTGIPLALCYREPPPDRAALLLAPVSPDTNGPLLRRALSDGERKAASITAVLAVKSVDADLLTTFFDCLARQTLAEAVDVVVSIERNPDADRSVLDGLLAERFSGRYTVVESDDGRPAALLNAAAGAARGKRLLLADPATVLHDPRTLETLYLLGLDDNTASAGCLVLREETFKKGSEVRFHTGGVFPSHVSLLSAPRLVFSEPYTLAAFPGATYPVVANTFQLAMVNTAIWSTLGGLDVGQFAHPRGDLDFCLRAHLAGYNNLCTAAVSVSCLSEGRAGLFVDSHALHALAPRGWQDLLSRVTILHDMGA